jgi:acyl carrier protein phosphodiesterase
MNYLGHIYLSGYDEPLMTGNFIGDYVKGKRYENFPRSIQNGIILHRAIDTFTDFNPHWQHIRERIRPVYKRYSGVVADLFVDHFLALHWYDFRQKKLNQDAKWAYAVMLKNYNFLPQRVQQFLPYLIQHRRLQSYASIDGIETTIRIMALRTSLPDHTKDGIALLRTEYSLIENSALSFIEDATNEFLTPKGMLVAPKGR